MGRLWHRHDLVRAITFILFKLRVCLLTLYRCYSAILEETGEHDSSEGVGEVIVPNNPAPVRMLRDSIDPKKLLEESGIMELVGRMPPRNSGRGERD